MFDADGTSSAVVVLAVPLSIIGAPGRRIALRTTPIAPDNATPRTALRHAASGCAPRQRD
ncbi:hypothetical protein ACPA9J_22005 [Pseudomonas aeruginosa]